jgi:two-component system chemotaxis sensor kinase CheA
MVDGGEQDEIVTEFLVEAHESLDALDRELMALEEAPEQPDLLASVFRRVHTVKGACGFLGFGKLESVAHAAESLLSKVREEEIELTPPIVTALLGVADTMREILREIEATGKEAGPDYAGLVEMLNELQRSRSDETGSDVPAAPPSQVVAAPVPARTAPVSSPPSSPSSPSSSPSMEPPAERASNVSDSYLRVDVSLLDKLMNLVGELVLARNQVLQVAALVEDQSFAQSFAATSQRLNLITTELQSGVMKTRMQPIGNLWEKLPRMVRDLAIVCGKKVRVEMVGNDTELDKTIIEAIKDPLTHLVRNCVDHGIERAADRAAHKKPIEGRLLLRAYHEGGQVNIEISDDGHGIDLDAIKNKAVERKLIAPERAARMSDRDAQNLIFLPGLSTAQAVSNVSGRGVGMDVVKTNIEKIGGVVDVQTRRGHGTTFRIKIPLTLAIIPALIVTSGGDRFAVPQVNLLELVRLQGAQARAGVETIHGAPVYRLRGSLLPLVYLNHELELEIDGAGGGGGDSDDDTVNIVVLLADNRRFGLVVDQVNDTEEIVVKPLGRHLKGITAFAGATIMGDGRVALILDILGIAQHARVVSEAPDRGPVEAGVAADKGAVRRQSLLLFLTRDGRRMAIPLSMVARLEEFPQQVLERLGSRQVVQYRGRILPLVDIVDLVASGGGGVAFGDAGDPSAWEDVHVVVYSDGQRSVGIMVGKIIDIVEEAVLAGADGGLVIEDKVTELIDLEELVRRNGASLFDVTARASSSSFAVGAAV